MNFRCVNKTIYGEEELVVCDDSYSNFTSYIVETIACNPQLNLICPVCKEMGDSPAYVYDVANMISLKDFLQNHEISTTTASKVLKGIVDTILKSGDYLIGMGKFVLLSDHIYIDEMLENMKFVVVPSAKNVFDDVDQAFKELVVDIMFNLVIYIDNGGGFIENLLNLLKKDFSLEALKRICVEYEQVESILPDTVVELFNEDGDSENKKDEEQINFPKKCTKKNIKIYLYVFVFIAFVFAMPSQWLADNNLNSFWGFGTKEILLGTALTVLCGKCIKDLISGHSS